MFPSFHKFYWAGLKYNDKLSMQQQMAVFRWIDQLIPGPSKYKHWGQAVLGDNTVSPEPNNLAGDEYCGGANVTQKYGQPAAWGWGDQSCSLQFSFMCRWGQLEGEAAMPNHLHTVCTLRTSRAERAVGPEAGALPSPACRTAAQTASPVYITKATGISFYLNTTPSTFNEAELGCQMNGGHLAAYSSFAEQQVGARCDSSGSWEAP